MANGKGRVAVTDEHGTVVKAWDLAEWDLSKPLARQAFKLEVLDTALKTGWSER